VATSTQQALTKERFLATSTFTEYVSRMKANKERMQRHFDEVQVSREDLDWWRSRGTLNVFILTYDGCGDAAYNIPVLAKIAAQASNLDIRVAQRDENLDIMDQHLNQGLYRSVPTFVFLDENYNEIANLKERSEEMTRVFEHEQLQVRLRLREEHKEPWRAEMLREFKNVVDSGKKYP